MPFVSLVKTQTPTASVAVKKTFDTSVQAKTNEYFNTKSRLQSLQQAEQDVKQEYGLLDSSLAKFKANELLVINKLIQSPKNFSNRDLIEHGIGHNERGITRSDMVPLLGHGSADQKHEFLKMLQ